MNSNINIDKIKDLEIKEAIMTNYGATYSLIILMKDDTYLWISHTPFGGGIRTYIEKKDPAQVFGRVVYTFNQFELTTLRSASINEKKHSFELIFSNEITLEVILDTLVPKIHITPAKTVS